MDKAYREGYTACCDGATECDCPYDIETEYDDHLNWLVGLYEARVIRENKLFESHKRVAKRRMNEAITRKAKERLNLLNDIVNFAYEYGENETKSLFQQAFKKAIGDDLVESLNDDD